MNLFTRWMTGKKLHIKYTLDDNAKVARVYVNKSDRHQTEEDRIHIQNMVNHFTNVLKYLVIVED